MNPICTVNFMRSTVLMICCVFLLPSYSQRGDRYRSEVLSNGDTAVWVKSVDGTIRIYFQKGHEDYVRYYRYRDTTDVDDMSIWQTYQSMLNQQVFITQRALGNLLVLEFNSLGFRKGSVKAVFMFDCKGRIVAVSHFVFSTIPNWFCSENLLKISNCMKREIIYPKMGGKKYYPWGIHIWPFCMERGSFDFYWMSGHYLH